MDWRSMSILLRDRLYLAKKKAQKKQVTKGIRPGKQAMAEEGGPALGDVTEDSLWLSISCLPNPSQVDLSTREIWKA